MRKKKKAHIRTYMVNAESIKMLVKGMGPKLNLIFATPILEFKESTAHAFVYVIIFVGTSPEKNLNIEIFA